jgi:hypothetical protein
VLVQQLDARLSDLLDWDVSRLGSLLGVSENDARGLLLLHLELVVNVDMRVRIPESLQQLPLAYRSFV